MREPDPVRVVASTPMVAELVRRVGAEAVEVEVLVPAGEAPSSLRRTGPVEARLITAELAVILGLGQEEVIAPSLARAVEAGTVVCELGAGLSREELFMLPDDPERVDPHIWLDPGLWMQATRPIEESLSALRPVWAGEFRKRAHAVRFELEEAGRLLRRNAQTTLTLDPRPLRTSRAELRYLARAAGVALKVDPSAASKDDLETVAFDVLRPPGTKVVANVREHDLGTVEGLRDYTLDLMLLRRK